MAAVAAVIGGLLLRPQPMQMPDATPVEETDEELLPAA